MAIDEHLRAPDAAAAADDVPAPLRLDGFALAPGEDVIDTLRVSDVDRFVLTNQRIIYAGGADDRRRWAFALLPEITAVEVARSPRERAALVWGVLGLIASVGIWQVATNATVGIVGGIAMAALGLLLLGDYYLRTPPSTLTFRAGGKDVGGPLTREAETGARAFADQLMHVRSELAAARAAAQARRPRFPSA